MNQKRQYKTYTKAFKEEHSRHSIETRFMLSEISGVVAYCLKKTKATH